MNITISEIRGPKQRMTRVFGYILVNNGNGNYSVHRKYYDDGSLSDGHYDMTLEEAWEKFKEKVDYLMSFGPGTFDKGEG